MSWEVWTMKLKTSFFEKTLFRKNITRFCPVWLIYLLIGVFNALSTYSYYAYTGEVAADVAESIPAMAVAQVVYALIVALCLFGDLFKARMCNAIHALPVRREQLFITNVLSGLIFSLIPNGAIALAMMLTLGSYWYFALLWLLAVELAFLFFFSLAAVCAMCTGSRFATAAVFTLINLLSLVIYWFIDTFYSPQLPGLHIRSDFLEWFCPVAKLSTLQDLIVMEVDYARGRFYFEGLSGECWYYLVLTVLAVAFLWLGVFLYRRRKLEKAGEFIVFKPLLPYFCIILTFSNAALFRAVGDLFGTPEISMLVGMIIGFVGGEMLIHRTTRVFHRKTVIKFVLIAGIFIGSVVLTAMDPLNRVNWLPETNQVESVIISDDYDYDPNEELWYGYASSVEISEPERVEQLIAIHEELLKDQYTKQEIYSQNGGAFYAIHLTYKLTNGTTVERRYYFPENSQVDKQVEQFYNMPEFIMGYRDWETFLEETDWVGIDSYTGESGWTDLEGAAAREVLTAIKADCEAGFYTKEESSEDLYWVNIERNIFFITSQCTNTVAAIEKYVN